MRRIPWNLLFVACLCVAVAACAPPRRSGGGGAIGGGGAGGGGNNGGGGAGGDVEAGGGDGAAADNDGDNNPDADGDGDVRDGAGDGGGEADGGDGGGNDGAGDDGDGDTDGGDGDGEASCEQILSCAAECDDVEECILSCRRQGSLAAQADFAALYSCATESECFLHDTGCLIEMCAGDAEACGIGPADGGDGGNDDGGDGDGGNDDGGNADGGNDDGGNDDGGDDGMDPPEGGSCADALLCSARCNPQDQQCQQDCLQSAEGEGRTLLSNLMACQQFTCDNDVECVQELCQEQAMACQSGQGGGAGLTCGGLFACASMFCVGAGGAPDQDCVLECQRGLDAGAMGDVQALSTCMQENGCQDQACAEENCGAEFDSCFEREV